LASEIRGRLSESLADGCEAKAGVGEYFAFYNARRLHQALGYRAPMASGVKARRKQPMDMWATQTR
jgi:hypothetical protein